MKYLMFFTLFIPFSLSSDKDSFSFLDKEFSASAFHYGVSEKLLKSICWVESKHIIKTLNRNDGGSASFGICQVKKNTSKFMRFKYNEKQMMQPSNNIKIAARYLKYQMDRYHNDEFKAVVAYNRGSYRSDYTIYVNKVFNVLSREDYNR